MFALLSLAAASAADEHTAFDGVLQFDALQTTPGTAPTASTSFTACISNCGNSAVQTNLVNALSSYSCVNSVCISANSITITCTGSCTTRQARSLLQVGGSTATITLPGATGAQLQQLQNNIAVGNLLNVGISSNVIVTGAVPVTPAAALVALGGTPALNPANPASPAAIAVCAATNTARLACIGRSTLALAYTTCASTLATVTSNGVTGAVCCACTGATNGVQVVAATTATSFTTLCRAAPNGYPGCGKRGSKKGLLGLLGLLGLIPLILCLLICCLCCLRRKRRGQAMLFSQTAVPAPIPAPLPHVHAEPHLHAGPDFHVHP